MIRILFALFLCSLYTQNSAGQCAHIYGDNLIKNGSFEAGNYHFESDYTYNTQNLYKEGHYAVYTSPSTMHSEFVNIMDKTSQKGNMLLVNGAAQANKVIWEQTVKTNPNQEYVFVFWATPLVPEKPAKFQVTVNGEKQGTLLELQAQKADWQYFAIPFISPENGTIELAITNQNTTPFGNDFALDDLVLFPCGETNDLKKLEYDTLQMGLELVTLYAPHAYELEAQLEKNIIKSIQEVYNKKNVFDIKIEIQGHTDDLGSEAENLELSKNRAETVFEVLKNNGVDPQVCTINYFGEKQPAVDAQTDSARQSNRRTQIIFSYKTTSERWVDVPQPQNFSELTLKDVETYIQNVQHTPNPTQQEIPHMTAPLELNEFNVHPRIGEYIDRFYRTTFTINPKKDTLLLGKRGGALWVEANTIKNPSAAFIVVELIECYKRSDMALLNIATQTTNHETLTSGGMVRVRFYDDNQWVTKLDRSVEIIIPSDTLDPNMQNYQGQIVENTFFETPDVIESMTSTKTIAWRRAEAAVSKLSLEDVVKMAQTGDAEAGYVAKMELLRRNPQLFERLFGNERPDKNVFYYYLTRLNNSNWVNLDYIPEEKQQDIFVKVPNSTKDINLKFVFKKLNGMLYANYMNKDKFLLKKAPKNEKAWMVGIDVTDKQTRLCLQPTTIKRGKTPEVRWENCSSIQELHERLQTIDN